VRALGAGSVLSSIVVGLTVIKQTTCNETEKPVNPADVSVL